MAALFVWAGGLLGGTEGAALSFAITLAINLIAYFASDKIVLAGYRAQKVGPQQQQRLHAIVSRLATKAQMPMPKVSPIPDRTGNAFATGRSPKHTAVAATVGILEQLDDDELEGVMAHELADALRKISRKAQALPMSRGNSVDAQMFTVNPFAGGLQTLISTHPPVQERIRRLQTMASERVVAPKRFPDQSAAKPSSPRRASS